MRRTRQAARQIICKLKSAEQLIAHGKTIFEVSRVIGVTQPTYRLGRQQYGDMQAEEVRRLTQLGEENTRPKKHLAETELEKAMLKDIAEGNFGARNASAGPSRFCRSCPGLMNASSGGWWGRTEASSPMPARSSTMREGAKLRHRIREIAAEPIRWDRRMAYRLLRRKGWIVIHKRVQKLWREKRQQRPTPRKQKRARPADGSMRRQRVEHPHQVGAMDFQFDAIANGRRLKCLNVIDEHIRLCLAIGAARRYKAKDVIAVLKSSPASTKGQEFIAQALQDWCEASKTSNTAYIAPRSPWVKSFAESFDAVSGMSS